MKLKSTKRMTAFIVGLVLSAGAVPAQEAEDLQEVAFEVDDGGPIYINLSGRLRMLSQMVPAAACQAESGFGTEYARGVMETATADFDNIIDALEFGNAELGLNYAEERRLTLAAIEDVRVAWAPLLELASAVNSGTVVPEQMASALENSDVLLKAAQALVVEEVAQYSNPAQMQQAESMLIDIAGRQRMLIQMMSKTACLSMSDFASEATSDALENTMGTFSATLDALQTGMESVGVRPPPTPEIAEGLAVVATQWTELKPFLDDVLAENQIDPEIAATKFRALNEMMAQMNAVVGLYAATVAF